MGKTIRVLHLIQQIGLGGAERQLCMLVSNTDPSQVQHEVLCYDGIANQEGLGLYQSRDVNLTLFNRHENPIVFLRSLAEEIKAREPDIVHCWLYSANIWGRLASLMAGCKTVIVSYRNCDIWHPKLSRIIELFTHKKIHYMANSRGCANFIANGLKLDPRGFHVIYNGLNFPENMSDSRKEIFRELRIPETDKVVTTVGRIVPQKNYSMFFKIAKRSIEQKLPLHFIAVGEGAQKDHFLRQAEILGLDQRLHFIGGRSDVPQILASSDYFLFTTNYEGFPNALLEAMAAGLPVITTDFDGVKELVADGENGRIVPKNDFNSAYEILHEFLRCPSIANSYGINARKYIEQEFTIERMVSETISYYNSLLCNT